MWIPRKDECNEFFSVLTSLYSLLRFTFGKECNRTLPFLDILVEKNYHEFVTSIYREPTFTGQYIRWNPSCPTKRKINLISTLVLRALVICLESTLQNELFNIGTILINNGYPEVVINTVIIKNESVLQTNTIRSEEMPCLSSLAMAGQYFNEVRNAN